MSSSAARGPWQATLPGEPVSVPAASQFVRGTLTGCSRADDLARAAAELADNAVRWSAARERGTFTLTIRTAPRWARIEVTDPGPATRPGPPGTGYGLGIVAMTTDRHGTTPGPGPAITTWAEATWPDTTPPARTGDHHAP